MKRYLVGYKIYKEEDGRQVFVEEVNKIVNREWIEANCNQLDLNACTFALAEEKYPGKNYNAVITFVFGLEY